MGDRRYPSLDLKIDRDRIIKVARSQIGVKESPPGSNMTQYNKWYGAGPNPWCAYFVSWVLAQAGHQIYVQTEKGFSYCPSGLAHFQKHGLLSNICKPGRIVFFDWYPGTSKSNCWHVGIALKHDKGYVYSIDGNSGKGSMEVAEMRRSERYVLGYADPTPTGNLIMSG